MRAILSSQLGLFALAGAILVHALASAFADGDPATDGVPRRVAYSGMLELDGLPFSGDLEMRFSLYDGDGGADAVWSEEYAGAETVRVYAGVFEVSLGRSGGLAEVVANADPLELGIEIRDPGGDGDWIPLGGRQAFSAVPYSIWAAESADFTIARDAFVGRNLDVVGDLTVWGTSHLYNVSAGPVSAGPLTAGSVTTPSLVASNATIGGGIINGDIRSTRWRTDGDYFVDMIGEESGAWEEVVNMTGTTDSFCFLIGFSAGDDAGAGDYTQCEIYQSDGRWVLRGRTRTSSRVTWCNARCFQYR